MNMKDSCRMPGTFFLLACFFLPFIPHTLAHNPGVIHITPEKGGDYCFLFPAQWMKPHQESNRSRWAVNSGLPTQNFTYSAMCCPPSFFGKKDSDGGGFSTRIASVREGDCNLFQNARLHPMNRTRGLLTLGGDAPYPPWSWRDRPNWGHCEEVTIPGILLNDEDVLYLLFNNLIRHLLYKTGIIYIMSVATVTLGSYWAGTAEKKKQHSLKSRYQAWDDLGEITIDTNICFTCTCTVMAIFTLLALCCFYDYLVHVMIGVFCLYATLSLYVCLTPFMNKLPLGKYAIHLPYSRSCLEIRTLLLAGLCLSINATWVIFRKDDQWGWILQDLLGVAIGIYILRTVHIPTFKNCSLFLLAHLFYDVLCLIGIPFLTTTGRGIVDVIALGTSSSEEIPFLLKAPILASTSVLDDSAFTVVGLGDIVLPGFLVAYCHRFDARVGSPGIYFLASTLAYSYGLLVTFVAATFLQASQSTLVYLVPCILLTSLAVAASRKEVTMFWTGVGPADDMSQLSLPRVIKYSDTLKYSKGQFRQQGRGGEITGVASHDEERESSSTLTEEVLKVNTHTEKMWDYLPGYEEDHKKEVALEA